MSCPSSIRGWVLNLQPLEYESSPMTTRPGLISICLDGVFVGVQADNSTVEMTPIYSAVCEILSYSYLQISRQLPMYRQLHIGEQLHIGTYIWVATSYRYLHIGTYIQVLTYRYLHIGTYIQQVGCESKYSVNVSSEVCLKQVLLLTTT